MLALEARARVVVGRIGERVGPESGAVSASTGARMGPEVEPNCYNSTRTAPKRLHKSFQTAGQIEAPFGSASGTLPE